MYSEYTEICSVKFHLCYCTIAPALQWIFFCIGQIQERHEEPRAQAQFLAVYFPFAEIFQGNKVGCKSNVKAETIAATT